MWKPREATDRHADRPVGLFTPDRPDVVIGVAGEIRPVRKQPVSMGVLFSVCAAVEVVAMLAGPDPASTPPEGDA
jgi:hypothetical protein